MCPPSPITSTNFERSGFHSAPKPCSVIQWQKKVRHPVGRVAWIAQPPFLMQCGHHSPGGLSSSTTAISLQHSVQVPQLRPGTTCCSAAAGSSLTGLASVIPPDYDPAGTLSSAPHPCPPWPASAREAAMALAILHSSH